MGRFLDFEGVDAVVFDCDGVLVDSEPISERAWRQTLDEFDVIMDEPFAAWVGSTDRALAERLAPLTDATADGLLDRVAAVLREVLADEGVDVFPDAGEAVARAEAAGLASAVASNSERWRLEALLEAAGLFRRFPVRVSSEDVVSPKPAPDVYLAAAGLLGVEPGRCLVVEDSPTGIASARAAGMRVVAVDRGVFDRSELAPATKVVERLDGGA